MSDFNESIVINSDNPWAYRNKGIYYYKKKELEHAERLFKQSISLDDQIPSSHYHLGLIYLQLGRKDDACMEFKVSSDQKNQKGQKAYQLHCL